MSFATPTGSDTSIYRLNNINDSSTAYPKTTTIIARISGSTLSTQRGIEIETAMSEAGATGKKLKMILRQSSSGSRGVQFENYAGSSGVHLDYPMDTSGFHIYHLALTQTDATSISMRLYVDGTEVTSMTPTGGSAQSAPFVLTRTASATGDNQLVFGDQSTSNTAYQSTLDWIVWTNAGAFTPAQVNGKLPAGLGTTTGY